MEDTVFPVFHKTKSRSPASTVAGMATGCEVTSVFQLLGVMDDTVGNATYIPPIKNWQTKSSAPSIRN
ncbi:MAG: hypothetical protein KC473_00220, partial [Candidatus Dadabacteria bacterium]|nr:hypothetical protein [Candidatus Dadabacteria bacterium]